MSTFQFRDFSVRQANSALKVGTDAMVLGALVSSESKSNILDIGTGTGVLSLMMAQRFPEAKVTAIEVDESSVVDARFNFERSPFESRLELYQSDFIEEVFQDKFDLIISNPPFYSQALKGSSANLNLAKHVSELTPKKLFQKVANILEDEGVFWLIWAYDDFETLDSEAKVLGFNLKTKVSIFGKPNFPKRVVAEYALGEVDVQESEFTIRDSNGKYTRQYIQLTKEFHHRSL